MGSTPNEDLKFCIIRHIDLSNINTYCDKFEKKWW